jgi:lipopolysaccharide export system protein LptC
MVMADGDTQRPTARQPARAAARVVAPLAAGLGFLGDMHPAARRHGRRRLRGLAWLKIALPLGALALMVAIVLLTDLNLGERFRMGVTELDATASDRFGFVNARIEGVDGKNRPFSITAAEATEIDDKTNLVELREIKADITLANGKWIAISADRGYYRQQSELLDLSGHIDLFHDRGYNFKTTTLRIDLERRTIVSYDPVTVQGPAGSLEAEGIRLSDSGDRVEFFGHSRLILSSGAGQGVLGE